jgi:hypothetical protein
MSDMARRSSQEINFSFNKNSSSRVVVHKKHMPIVRCVCGFEILVLPDLKAMNLAIKNHLGEHKQTHNDADRLDLFDESLTKQVLIEASKMNLPNVS